MTETNVDEGQPYDREHWQRLNRDYAVAGLPPVMPEDWAAINAMAEQMDAVIRTPGGELDHNLKGQAAAAEKLQWALRPDTYDLFNELNLEQPATGLDTTWFPDYQDGDTCLRAYVYNRLSDGWVWVPLQRFEQWTEAATAYRHAKSVCQVHSVPGCDYFRADPVPSPEKPLTDHLVNRGETLVILFVCPLCRERMDDPSWTAEDCVQRGPMRWYDSGAQNADGDSDA
jgi:hypothetical protein